MVEKINNKIKKNILDLQYTKYLQYYNTSIIILFTYFIGIIISLVTKQIDYTNIGEIIFLTATSMGVIVMILLFMLNFNEHQHKILEEIKKLNRI